LRGEKELGRLMKARIADFEQDAHGHWMALLECGHRRPVRHRPPWQNHPWVLSETGRREHLGMAIHCRECTAESPPPDVVELRRTRTFTQADIPAGLRRRHVLPAGTWARIHVLRGRLRCRFLTEPPRDVHVTPSGPAVLAPGVPHAVEPLGEVAFFVSVLGQPKDPGSAPVG
jgi:tellurite methyltransferase